MGLSTYDIKRILNPKKDRIMTDDFRVIDSWAEYDDENAKKSVNERPLEQLCYELETINSDTGEKTHFYKAIKFCRVIRLPKSSKQSLSFMDMHTQVLSAVYEKGINLVTIIANVIEPVPLGLLFLYGVQGVGSTLEEAKRKAHDDYIGFTAAMQGTYKVLELRCVNAQETEWLREKMYGMEYLTVVRGVPKANKGGVDAGNKGMGGENLNPNSQGTLEEIITGMADYEYVIQILSTPVYLSTLKEWSLKTERDMTDWYSQLQGNKSFSLSLSVPMMFATNQSSSQGWNKAYTDAESVNYSRGESFNQTYGENVGQALSETYSQSMGRSFGQSVTNTISSSRGTSYNQSFGRNIGESSNQSLGQSFSQNTGRSFGLSQNQSASQGNSTSFSQGSSIGNTTGISSGTSQNMTRGDSYSTSQNVGQTKGESLTNSNSVGQTITNATGNSITNTQGYSYGEGKSQNYSYNAGSGYGYNEGKNWNNGYNEGWNQGKSTTTSNGVNGGVNVGAFGIGGNTGKSNSTSTGYTDGYSYGYSNSNGGSTGEAWNKSTGETWSKVTSANESWSNSISNGQSWSQSIGNSATQSISKGQSISMSESYGINRGTSLSQGYGINQSTSQSQSISQNVNNGWGTNNSVSMGTGSSENNSFSQGSGISTSNGFGQSSSQSSSTGQGSSYSISQGRSVGQSYTESMTESVGHGYTRSFGQSQSVGRGQSYSQGQGQSHSESIGASGTVSSGMSSSMGLGPSIGYNKSYQWLDQEVKDILELLECQNERIKKALRSNGAFYTYVYIACPSQDALSAARTLAKSTWQNEFAMVNPLQVLNLPDEEQQHLLYKFSAFSSDVSKEYVAGVYEYKYCTVLLPDEFVAYTHLPRISEGGIFAEINDVPKFSVPSMLPGEIYMGTILSAERYTMKNGYRTPYDYRIDESELMHGWFTGASRSGKTVAAMRFIAELAQVKRKKTGKRLRIVCMDPKQDWRTLARFVEPERFRFHSLGNTVFRPIKINPLKIPRGVEPQFWIDGLIDIYCRAYGLLERGKQMLGETIYKLYEDAGVFDARNLPDWKDRVTELSSQVTFTAVYQHMFNIKASLEDPTNPKGRAGNDTRDAYARLLDRLQAFNREFSIEHKLFGTSEGIGIDELIGDDDVTVLESKGLENTFRNFIFGVITSGFYKYAIAHEGGYLAENQYETLLVIEEANEVLTGSDVAGTGGGSTMGMSGQSEFEQILDQSAGYGLFIMAITQQISAMPKSIIANSGLMFAGRLKTPDDITVVVRSMGREERYEDRDLVKWFPRSPTGWFVCMSSRTFDFKDSEPILVQISRLNIAPPTNAEIDEILVNREALAHLSA